jgi:hypothetical protein
LLAGDCPAASNFLLLRQKNVTKEKATRSLDPYASLRATCGARAKRGLAKLAFGSNNASPDPLVSALLGPARTGKSEIQNTELQYTQGHAMACPCGFRYSVFVFGCWLFGIPVPTPLWMRRAPQVAPERSAGDAGTRVAFSFAYFSFGEAKEK